ncbi:phosphatase PAP2 family protein [Nakamurella silvestris]|nr:phosphatase PAP2 family protein [Nakamurella silvestris]
MALKREYPSVRTTDELPDPREVPPVTPMPHPIDVALRNLTLSANHGRLWMGVAAAGVIAGGRWRRAGIRGLLSLSAASLISNSLIKPVVKRRRPDIERTKLARRIGHKPWTSSFPSGHSASAAAFATGAALELPRAGLVLGPLAAAVAYSRVHVGVHYPSDVVVGAAVGATTAVIGRKLWPVRPAAAALCAEATAPALPQGKGLAVVVNTKSGSAEDAASSISQILPGAVIIEWDPSDDAPEIADLLDEHSGLRALGVAGGDGTVATVAGIALERGLPLAVFPAGTLNHFAKALNLTTDEDTAQALTQGTAGGVDVALLDGIPFLNTASVGGYPELVLLRDRLAARMGKWPAAAVSAWRVLRRAEPMELVLNGQPEKVWTLFVGNGHYTPRGLSSAWRDEMSDGLLDVQFVRADPPFSRLRAVVGSFVGLVQYSKVYGSIQTSDLRVRMADKARSVAHDGEVAEPRDDVRITVAPTRLTVYRAG